MIRLSVILAGGLLLTGCASTGIERTSVETPDGEVVDSAVARQAGGERLICSREPAVGTRLPNRSTCRTQAEWDRIAAGSREEVDRVQRGPIPNRAQQ